MAAVDTHAPAWFPPGRCTFLPSPCSAWFTRKLPVMYLNPGIRADLQTEAVFRGACWVSHRHVRVAAYGYPNDFIDSRTAQRLPPGRNRLSDVRSCATRGAARWVARAPLLNRAAVDLVVAGGSSRALLTRRGYRTCTCECRAASTDSEGAARRTVIGATRRVMFVVAAVATGRAYAVGCRTAAIVSPIRDVEASDVMLSAPSTHPPRICRYPQDVCGTLTLRGIPNRWWLGVATLGALGT